MRARTKACFRAGSCWKKRWICLTGQSFLYFTVGLAFGYIELELVIHLTDVYIEGVCILGERYSTVGKISAAVYLRRSKSLNRHIE